MSSGRGLVSRILFVADASHSPDLPALVAAAVAGGVRLVEIRRPSGAGTLGSRERLAEIVAVRAAAPGATLLVNDRVDLALLARADGAHVGQDDLPARAARDLLGTERWLGLSTHDEDQAARASDEPVDYVAIGPVFASRTKSGHAEPLGLQRLRRVRGIVARPLVAIGGIDAASVRDVLDAGADAVAVAAAISAGPGGAAGVADRADRLLRLAGQG